MRWFYSTDARDIGILYLFLSALSGVLGTMMSMYIRVQLMDVNQSAVLNMPNSVYNSVITVHALLMIFFLVMPAMFGAFGETLPRILFFGLKKKLQRNVEKDLLDRPLFKWRVFKNYYNMRESFLNFLEEIELQKNSQETLFYSSK